MKRPDSSARSSQPNTHAVVCHDLTPLTRKTGLVQAVLSHPVVTMAEQAIAALVEATSVTQPGPAPRRVVPLQIDVPESPDCLMHSEPPLSRASSLPQGIDGGCRYCGRPATVWERACSRWRYQIRHHCWLTIRIREQARSHRRLMVDVDIAANRQQCGSELARDGGIRFDIIVG